MFRGSAAKRRAFVASAGIFWLAVAGDAVWAQQWPTRNITAISPFGPGTSLEAAARPVFVQMSQELGQPIVIEHRPGAGSTTGSGAAARATPDGYTLLLQSSTFAIAHSVFRNRTYDTVRDFVPIVSFGVQPYVLVVAPSKGFKTVADLVTAAKANPGTMNYASLGVGSAPHVAAERFRLSAGIEAQNVSFRGPPEALTETMTGRIDFYFIPLGSALSLIKDGKLAALAVSTANRTDKLPDVPTIKESGLQESGFELWVGLFAPVKTPPEIIARLHAAAQNAMQVNDVKQRLDSLSLMPLKMTQPEFSAYFQKDVEETASVIAKAKIEVQ